MNFTSRPSRRTLLYITSTVVLVTWQIVKFVQSVGWYAATAILLSLVLTCAMFLLVIALTWRPKNSRR